MAEVVAAIRLTLTLAAIVTALLLVIGTPLAWWLARTRVIVREPIAALVSLPLVLPPTVLGFYLLIALGPNGPGGMLAGLWGARTLAFSFPGLVLGSVLYSLPFMVQPLRNSFEAIGEDELEVAASLGASPWKRFVCVAMPLARNGYVTGAILTFAHTVGEFGVVLMIGGNIPGQTRVLSVQIYNFVERGDWADAHRLALGMVVFAFAVIAITMAIDRRVARPVPA